MIPTESDVFWTKPVGKSPVGQANNAQSPAKTKSHGNRWGRAKSSKNSPCNSGVYPVCP
jgi:hypothetical protein